MTIFIKLSESDRLVSWAVSDLAQEGYIELIGAEAPPSGLVDDYFFDGNELVYSPAPSPSHDWDAANHVWVENADRAAELAAQAARAAVPKSVTMRQARLALLQAELLDEIDAAMKSDAIDRAIKIEWEFASEVHRDWSAIGLIKQMFGMTDEQLDGLFVMAATL